jgi:hypothetical protein
VGEKERGKRERKRRTKVSNALGEGAIGTPSPTVGTTYVKETARKKKNGSNK